MDRSCRSPDRRAYPRPAAITVLLICIQLKALTLGATMVPELFSLARINAGDAAALRGDAQQAAKALERLFDASFGGRPGFAGP